MLKIRLARVGKKHQPFYRIAVFESHKDPFGDYIERLGHYNPRTKEIKLNAERIKYWIEHGAQTSDTIHNLLVEQKVIEGKKLRVSKISKKRIQKMAEKKKGAKPKEEPKAAEKKSEKPDDQPEKPEAKKEEPKESSSAKASDDKEKPAEKTDKKTEEKKEEKKPEEKPKEEPKKE